MADNIPINAPTTVGKTVASRDIGGIQHEQVIMEFDDGAGGATEVSASNPMPVTDAVAEAALAVLVAGQQSDGLTDVELRASPVPITGTVAVTGGGDATAANQVTGNTSLGVIKTNTDKIPSQGQALAAASTPVVLTAAEETILSAILTISDFDTKTGSLTETAPATDTASSGLNGRLQRIAQRITSLIALLPTALGAGGGLKVDGSGTALPVSGTVAVTGAGDASAANQTLQITQETAFNTVMGLIADAAVTAGATGSISAKLRAISRDIVANIVLAAGTNLIGITQSKDLPDASATYALTNVTSSAYEASHVIKASAGYLFMVTGYNSRTSSQFIMISNTTSVPADAQTPVIVFIVPASSNFSFDLGKYGRYFSTGICIFNSSTSPTKTLGSADCFFDVQFI